METKDGVVENSPNWTEIFREIGVQLPLRSGLLAKRIFAIALPATFLFVLVFLLSYIPYTRSILNSLDSVSFVLYGVGLVIIIAIFTIVMVAVSKIEQVVWLDSYFDGKKLTPQESWKIAKRLYVPWGKLQIKLFLRYYVWIIVATIAIILVVWNLTNNYVNLISENSLITLSSVIVITLGVLLILITRYLKIKLSYAPFIFLDMYQGETSSSFWKEFFSELNQLNIVSKDQSFKKNVLLEIGADTAVTLVEFIASKMAMVGGPMFGTILTPAKEVAIRIIYFAKLTGRYVLYRFAFKTVHGSTHIVNEYVYKLVEEN